MMPLTDTTQADTGESKVDGAIASLWARTVTALKNASTTVKGIVELATNTETITGTDTSRAVTPASLQAKVASVTKKGLVELATVEEAEAGTDTERAVTPAGVKAGIDTIIKEYKLETRTEIPAEYEALALATTLTVKAGCQMFDKDTLHFFGLTDALTKDINSLWAVGANSGCLAIGVPFPRLNAGHLFLWMIYNTVTKVTDFILNDNSDGQLITETVGPDWVIRAAGLVKCDGADLSLNKITSDCTIRNGVSFVASEWYSEAHTFDSAINYYLDVRYQFGSSVGKISGHIRNGASIGASEWIELLGHDWFGIQTLIASVPDTEASAMFTNYNPFGTYSFDLKGTTGGTKIGIIEFTQVDIFHFNR
jgi:hypothetical protein